MRLKKEKLYYNYIYLDPRKPGKFTYEGLDFCLLYSPYYIGKGTNNRYLDHIKEANKNGTLRGKHKNNKILKIQGLGYIIKDYVIQLNFTTNELDALNKEKDIIDVIGRLDKKLGPLTNLTEGGDGVSGRVVCKNGIGDVFSVLKNEFDKDDNLEGINKNTKHESRYGMVQAYLKDGSYFGYITKEEFNDNDKYVGINYSKINSEESNDKNSKNNINRVTVRDENNNIFKVSIHDERYLNGKLVPANKGIKMKERVCPHCGKRGRGGNMTRYHFDNCSLKVEV